jgi:protein arginine N-methyltransferase 3
MMKLVNYIRSEVKAGNLAPNVSNASAFQDQKYLLPVLEDDPLLYSLHDAFEDGFEDEKDEPPAAASGTLANGAPNTDPTVELERKLQLAQLEIEARRNYIEDLRLRAKAHEDEVPSMIKIAEELGRPLDADAMELGEKQSKTEATSDAVDSLYFASYNGHGESESEVRCQD